MERSLEDYRSCHGHIIASKTTPHIRVSQPNMHQGSMHLLKPASADHLRVGISGGNLSSLTTSRDRQLITSKADLRSVRSSNLNIALNQLQIGGGSHTSINAETERTDEEDDDDEDGGLPAAPGEIDGQYSWVVLFACILLQLLASIPSVSSGIFFVELVKTYPDRNKHTIAWIYTLQASSSFLMGPVAGFINDKIGGRICAMLGCAGAGLVFAIAAIASSFELIFICIVSSGAFSCLMLVPGAVCTAPYFKKYKTLALAAGCVCVPLAFIVIPPIVTNIIITYGWRQGYIFLASLCFQGAVVGALLRPFRRIQPKANDMQFNADYNSTMSVFGRLRKYSFSNHGESQYSLFVEDQTISQPAQEKLIDEEKKFDKLEPYCMAKRLLDHNYESQVTSFKSDCTLDSIPEFAPLKLINLDTEEKPKDEELSAEPSSEDIPEIDLYNSKCKRPAVCHWRVVVLIVSNATWGFGASTCFVFLPTYANYYRISATEVSYIFSAMGLAGIAGRVVAVIICYFVRRLDKVLGLAVTMFLQAGALFGLTMVTSFEGLCTFSAIYTFMYGVNTCLGIPAIVEVHGNKQLALIYGLELLSYGIGNSISTPIATYMGSELGAYKMGVQLSGAIVIIGGLILLPHLIIKYICNRQSADMENNEES